MIMLVFAALPMGAATEEDDPAELVGHPFQEVMPTGKDMHPPALEDDPAELVGHPFHGR